MEYKIGYGENMKQKINIAYGKWIDCLGNVWNFSVPTDTLNEFIKNVEAHDGIVYKNITYHSFEI